MAIPYDWSAASRRAAENGRDEWARALATGFLAERRRAAARAALTLA